MDAQEQLRIALGTASSIETKGGSSIRMAKLGMSVDMVVSGIFDVHVSCRGINICARTA